MKTEPSCAAFFLSSRARSLSGATYEFHETWNIVFVSRSNEAVDFFCIIDTQLHIDNMVPCVHNINHRNNGLLSLNMSGNEKGSQRP